MELRDLLRTVADSAPADWGAIMRPTGFWRFVGEAGQGGAVRALAADQHPLYFVHKPDIRIGLAFGLVENAAYPLPAEHPFGRENASSVLLDCLLDGRPVHRETLVMVDRNRCLLPCPASWEPDGLKIPALRRALARLVHLLAGPPTDFDDYFGRAGMRGVDLRWP